MLENVKTWMIPEGEVVKAERDGVLVWKKIIEPKNWAKYSTESDDVTIYNNGQGIKIGTRIRSGGAEGTESRAICTGYIPAKPSNIFRLYTPDSYAFATTMTASAINIYDSGKNCIGQLASNGVYGNFSGKSHQWSNNIVKKNGMFEWTIPSDVGAVAYIRVTVGHQNDVSATGEGLIITINEEISL